MLDYIDFFVCWITLIFALYVGFYLYLFHMLDNIDIDFDIFDYIDIDIDRLDYVDIDFDMLDYIDINFHMLAYIEIDCVDFVL